MNAFIIMTANNRNCLLPNSTNLVFRLSVSSELVLSVDDDFCSQPMAERRLTAAAGPPSAARPVVTPIVLDFVIPRD